MDSKKIVAGIIVALIGFCCLLCCASYIFLASLPPSKTIPTPTTTVKKPATIITVYSLDKNTKYGDIWVANNRLNHNVEISSLRTYLNTNFPIWQATSLKYPTGGMTADGALWDGLATTDISKPDFMNGVYSQLSEDQGQKYYFDLN